MRFQWYDIVQLLGSIASITGLTLLGGASEQTRTIISVLIIIGVFATLIASICARAQPMTKVGRCALIDTGRSIIRGVKTEVIMFGGDMSWAVDYEEAIRYATDRGKTILVIFPVSVAAKVVQNAALIAGAGGQLYTTPFDAGLRGILVDANDGNDAMLYMTNRRLKKRSSEIEIGQRGTEQMYDYVAKIYRSRRDYLLIRSVKKMADLALKNANPWILS